MVQFEVIVENEIAVSDAMRPFVSGAWPRFGRDELPPATPRTYRSGMGREQITLNTQSVGNVCVEEAMARAARLTTEPLYIRDLLEFASLKIPEFTPQETAPIVFFGVVESGIGKLPVVISVELEHKTTGTFWPGF